MTYSLEIDTLVASIDSLKANLTKYQEIYEQMKTEFDKLDGANFAGKTGTTIVKINKELLDKTEKKINELTNFISYLENVKQVYNNMYGDIKDGVNNG